jgi:hypothetical protein
MATHLLLCITQVFHIDSSNTRLGFDQCGRTRCQRAAGANGALWSPTIRAAGKKLERFVIAASAKTAAKKARQEVRAARKK